MRQVTASQLHSAARIADALVYPVGVAGVAAGGLLYHQGFLAFTVVAWALTFCFGAGLRLVAWATRGIAQLLERADQFADQLERIEQQQRRLAAGEPPRSGAERPPPDPYGRWGWH